MPVYWQEFPVPGRASVLFRQGICLGRIPGSIKDICSIRIGAAFLLDEDIAETAIRFGA